VTSSSSAVVVPLASSS